MGKCPHCGSKNIRKRYRKHKRYKWRCRNCNKIFRSPVEMFATSTPLNILIVVIIVLVISLWGFFAIRQDVLTPEPTQAPTAITRAITMQTPEPTPTAIPNTPMRILPPTAAPRSTSTNTSTPVPIAIPVLEPTDTPTPIPTATHTPVPTNTPTPTPTATHTPEPTPTATRIPGRADLYEPIPLPEHMATIHWVWDWDPSSGEYIADKPFRVMEMDFTIHNDPGDFSDQYGLYLILGGGIPIYRPMLTDALLNSKDAGRD